MNAASELFDIGARTRTAPKSSEEYAARKIRGMNVHQLAKLARRLPRRARKVSSLLGALHKESKFRSPLAAQAFALNVKQSILTEEGIRRNALALD